MALNYTKRADCFESQPQISRAFPPLESDIASALELEVEGGTRGNLHEVWTSVVRMWSGSYIQDSTNSTLVAYVEEISILWRKP